MTEPLTFALASVAGLVLGAFFFGGLWWTVRRGISAKHPAPWFVVSLLLRMGIVLAGFYLVGRGHPERMLACLFGFIVARVLVKRLTGSPVAAPGSRGKEAVHAPDS
ncbi:MAG: ATP synthase subunit I [Candidatus Krumholzibacteriia bacterium]